MWSATPLWLHLFAPETVHWTVSKAARPPNNPTSFGENQTQVPLAAVAAPAVALSPDTTARGGIMTDQKASKTTDTTCDTSTFTDIPPDLIARLKREADRRCVLSHGTSAKVPLAHLIILSRRDD